LKVLALILGLSLVAAACGGDDDEGDEGAEAEDTEQSEVPEGGTLVLGAEQEPECIDWISSCAGASWGFWTMNVNTMPRSFDIVEGDDGGWVYEPSILLDGEPELETDPDQVITYTISDDAVWSDNEPITCADYAYTWDQIANGDDIYDTTGYANIASVECPSDKEVVVTFETPYSGWKQLFGGQYGIYPSHILEGQDRNAMMANGYDFSAGPWVIENWEKGVEVSLIPNENYWGEQPKLDKVIFTFLADTSSEFQAFKAGEVKAIYPQPQLDAVAEIEAGIPNTQSDFTSETPNTEGLWMNNARAPFDSVAVRQAFAYTLDRAAIVERLFGAVGVTEPLNSFNAPILGDFGDPDAFAGYEQDFDMVDQLMEGDGWAKGADGIWAKGGERATIEFKTTSGNARRELTQQIVQEQAGEGGFEITINNREAGDLFGTDLPSGDYQLALYAQVMTGLDPTLCAIFCSQNVPSEENQQSGQNWTRTVVDGLDEPLTVVDSALDRDEQSEAQAEADALMAEDLVSLPLDPLPNILLWSDDIAGPVTQNPIFGPFYNMELWGLNA
jgi:peptide/nickel transport system substrate-binding protein